MGWLAAQGAIMAIGLFIGLVCSVIGLFFGHIILFDSIALGIAAGVCCNQFTAIHPVLCKVYTGIYRERKHEQELLGAKNDNPVETLVQSEKAGEQQ